MINFMIGLNLFGNIPENIKTEAELKDYWEEHKISTKYTPIRFNILKDLNKHIDVELLLDTK